MQDPQSSFGYAWNFYNLTRAERTTGKTIEWRQPPAVTVGGHCLQWTELAVQFVLAASRWLTIGDEIEKVYGQDVADLKVFLMERGEYPGRDPNLLNGIFFMKDGRAPAVPMDKRKDYEDSYDKLVEEAIDDHQNRIEDAQYDFNSMYSSRGYKNRKAQREKEEKEKKEAEKEAKEQSDKERWEKFKNTPLYADFETHGADFGKWGKMVEPMPDSPAKPRQLWVPTGTERPEEAEERIRLEQWRALNLAAPALKQYLLDEERIKKTRMS